MKHKNLPLSLLVLAFGAANSLAAEKYEIDPVHSNIGFTVRHMVIAKVSGRFKDDFVAIRDLTIRGVTKEVALPFKVLGKIKDPRGKTRVGFEAGITLNRFDYGVKWDKALETGGLVVSEEVEVNLAVEAIGTSE